MDKPTDLQDDLLRGLMAGAGGLSPEEMEARGWSIEDQADQVLAHYLVHCMGGSVMVATDRELYLFDLLIESKTLPESARERFRRMDPQKQPEREEWWLDHYLDGRCEEARELVERHFGPRIERSE